MIDLMMQFANLDKVAASEEMVLEKVKTALAVVSDVSVLYVDLKHGALNFDIEPTTDIDAVINAVESLGCTYVENFGPRDTQTLDE